MRRVHLVPRAATMLAKLASALPWADLLRPFGPTRVRKYCAEQEWLPACESPKERKLEAYATSMASNT
jgi:hypothetical protein